MKALARSILCSTALVVSAPGFAAEAPKAEVMHSWTSGGEAAALKVIVDEFAARGGEWSDASIAGFENANAAYMSRIMAGNPPTARTVVFGLDQRELMAQGLLNELDAIATEGKWSEVIPPTLYETLGYDGHVYLAPVNLHGESWMFYSKPVFEAAGIAGEPATWDEFFAAMDKIKAAGLVPIAWGGQSWQEAIVFNAVLASQLGVDGYRKFYQGDAEVLDSPGLLKAAEVFGRMRDYVDPASPGRNWNDATAMVITDKAGVQFMGDWAKGEFIAAGKVVGTDYGCAIVPGSDGMVIIGDAFSFPKTGDANQDAAQKILAEVVTDPIIQVEFAKKKGSFPVRQDVDTSALDACAQTAMSLLEAGKVSPEPGILLPPDKTGALEDVIADFWSDPSISPEDMVESFKAAMVES